MRKTLPICVALLFVATEAMACPECTYQRVMPTWPIFAAARILAICAIAFTVLDVVRAVEVFIVYEVSYFFAWRMAVWYLHLAVSGGLVQWLAVGALLILSAGIPAALVLKLISSLEWFRRKPDRCVSWKRALLVLPVFYAIAVVEGMITSR